MQRTMPPNSAAIPLPTAFCSLKFRCQQFSEFMEQDIEIKYLFDVGDMSVGSKRDFFPALRESPEPKVAKSLPDRERSRPHQCATPRRAQAAPSG
jgi:hypothetical protein